MSQRHFNAIEKAIRGAGFYTTIIPEDSWPRILCAAKCISNTALCGNTIWIAKQEAGWFLGTYGGLVYLIPDGSRVADLAILLLSRDPDRVITEVDPAVQTAFDLALVDDPDDRGVETSDNES